MSTYVLYYQSPMVHAPSTYQCTSPYNPHPALKLPSQGLRMYQQPSIALKTSTSSSTSSEPKSLPSKNGSMNEQEESLFFQLPAELRNEIYKELLCPDALTPKQVAGCTKDLAVRGFNQTSTSVQLYPAILSTCQKITYEAESFLYGKNIFHAHPSLLTSLPHLTSPSQPVLSPRHIAQIRRWQISLRLDTDPRFGYEQAKRAFSGAEYLEIRVWQAQFEACDFGVLKLFTGVRGVGVARVGGSVDEELARWLEKKMMEPEDNGERVKCKCEAGEESMWESRKEVLCGRCYKKLGAEWVGGEWDVWKLSGR